MQDVIGRVLNDNKAGLYFTAAYLTVLKGEPLHLLKRARCTHKC